MRYLLSILLVLMASATLADDDVESTIRSYKKLLRELKKVVKADADLGGQIESLKARRSKLKSQRKPRGDQGHCNDCVGMIKNSCNNKDVCKGEGCRVSSDGSVDSCYRVFQAKRCFAKAISASERARIANCWKVARDEELSSIEEDLEELQKAKKEAEGQYDEKKTEIANLEEENPYLKDVRTQHEIDEANERRSGDAPK